MLLFLYSFTQVDLSLTFSRASIYQSIEKSFQYVGWFDRPISTYLYIAIFIILFILYFWTLRLVSKKSLSRKIIWFSIFIVTLILLLSYNAFSYDIFNYIFDAKIITHYHQNPYIHKALDFPGDPMLSFMHWTQRTYPYGPVWLLFTAPLSFISGHFFIVSFYLFKILMAAFFLLTVYSIEKIGKILKFENTLLSVSVFAFNPFLLSESLVSAHNDIVMMGLLMYGIYFLLNSKNIKGWILVLLSIGVKFATGLFVLAYFFVSVLKKKIYLLELSLVLMIIAVVLASLRTNFQPWYLLYISPFASLLYQKKYIKFPFFVFSVAAVIYYIPFLYTGNWDPPIPLILDDIVLLACFISILIGLLFFFKKKNKVF